MKKYKRFFVKDSPTFKNAWRHFGDDDRFKSWKEVEEHYHFTMTPTTNLDNSIIEFKSEEHYTMFLIEWR